MRVHELIAALQALPRENQAREIWTEGCDCYGDVGSVGVEGETVYLYRNSPEDRPRSTLTEEEVAHRAGRRQVKP